MITEINNMKELFSELEAMQDEEMISGFRYIKNDESTVVLIISSELYAVQNIFERFEDVLFYDIITANHVHNIMVVEIYENLDNLDLK